jgi:hypothetical protein
MRAESDYGRFGMVAPRLTAEAAALAKTDLLAFRNRCGYEYVGQVRKGVLAAAVYTVKNLSQSSKKHLQASFNAGIGGAVWDVQAKASYEEFIKQAAAEGSLELKIYLVGGGGITIIVPTIEKTSDVAAVKKDLIAYAQKMGPENAVPISYVSGSLASFVPALANLDFDNYIRTIDNLFFYFQEFNSRGRKIHEYILAADDFGLGKAEWNDWHAIYQKYEDAKQEVVDAARKCRFAYSNMVIYSSMNTNASLRGTLEAQSRAIMPAAELSQFKLLQPLIQSPMAKKGKDVGKEPDEEPSLPPDLYEVCKYDAKFLDFDMAKSVPSYPFEFRYSVTQKTDAAGKPVFTLVYMATGAKIDYLILKDGTGTIQQVSSASGSGGATTVTGTLDVTTLKTGKYVVWSAEVKMITGGLYTYTLVF